MTDLGPNAEQPLTLDERAAIRAFLQRSEVRLSTVHRVATALLSGAGLMVLLPAVERDSVVIVLRPLLSGGLSSVHLLLVAAVVASLAVPFTALWLVFRDLTQFYFHANHIRHPTGEAFTPRFTLTGLRLPADELDPRGAATLDAARRAPQAVELLVPANDAARRRIDHQVTAYGQFLIDADRGDLGRADALFALAASHPRTLLAEVAKVEHGLARHVLSIQVIVLRYAKALLALLITAFSAFACAAVVDGRTALSPGDEVWLGGILVIWAPVAIVAVTSPVRWLQRQLRNEGVATSAVSHDPELTRVELVTIRLALAGFAAAAAALLTIVLEGQGATDTRTTACAVLVAGLVALIIALRSWDGRPTLRRILSLRAEPRARPGT